MRRFGVKSMFSIVSNVSSGCYVVRADVLCFPTACGTGRKAGGGEGGGESVEGLWHGRPREGSRLWEDAFFSDGRYLSWSCCIIPGCYLGRLFLF